MDCRREAANSWRIYKYIPNPDFVETESFTYNVESNTARITVKVHEPRSDDPIPSLP
jgi:hypothetical protein